MAKVVVMGAGLGGAGDRKGLMESVLRQRHIHWITNAKAVGVEAGVMTVAERAEDGSVKKGHRLPCKDSRVSAICENVAAEIAGQPATARGTRNAICRADFGDTGAAFVALPQIPPRHEKYVLSTLGIESLKS